MPSSSRARKRRHSSGLVRGRDVGHRCDHHLQQRQVRGVDVGSHLAGCLGALDQGLSPRTQLVADAPHPLAARSRAEQDFFEPAIAGLQLGHAGEEVDERGPWIVRGERLLGEGDDLVHALLKQRNDELLARAEPAIRGADPDAGALRDVIEGDREPALREQLPRRLEEALSVALGITAQGLINSGHVPIIP